MAREKRTSKKQLPCPFLIPQQMYSFFFFKIRIFGTLMNIMSGTSNQKNRNLQDLSFSFRLFHFSWRFFVAIIRKYQTTIMDQRMWEHELGGIEPACEA
jgi:hypothetical protein